MKSMRLSLRIAVALLSLLLPAGVFAQSHPSLNIRGDVLKPGTLTPEAVKQQFAAELQTIKYTVGRDGDKQEKIATGVPLISVIKAAELKTEPTPKHYDLSFFVILGAHDGFRAFFSLVELMAAKEKTLLVVEEDGKPLSGDDAPFKLLTDGSDRRIFGITSITLVDGIKLSDSLAKK